MNSRTKKAREAISGTDRVTNVVNQTGERMPIFGIGAREISKESQAL